MIFLFFVFRGRCSTLWTLQCTFRGRCRTLWMLKGRGVQISWQAQDFVDLEVQISWQAQDFVDVEVQS